MGKHGEGMRMRGGPGPRPEHSPGTLHRNPPRRCSKTTLERHMVSHASHASDNYTKPPKGLGTVGGVAREGDSRGAVVAHVAKDHRLNDPGMTRSHSLPLSSEKDAA